MNEEMFLLTTIIEEGCLPEFDSYYDENKQKVVWVCSFHTQGSFIIGKDTKTTIEGDTILELLEKVAEKLKI